MRELKGFSLIEVTVVMIILAILSTIVLGSFNQIEKQKSQHAMTILKQIKDNVIMCTTMGGTNCDRWGYDDTYVDFKGKSHVIHRGLDMDEPLDRNFNYEYIISNGDYVVSAVRKENPEDKILMKQDGCQSFGIYQGVIC